MNPRYAWVRQLVALAVFLAIWEAAGHAGMLNPLFIPMPSKIGAALYELFADGRIWPHLEATFAAALIGLAFGIAAGILLGVTAAILPLVAELLEPLMTLLNAIPRVILAPLFVIWLGIGLASKAALAFILVAVLIFFTVFTGIQQVDRRLIERIVTLGGGRWALVRHVYLPSVRAWVLGNMKVAVGFAFTGAVVGAFVAATEGLGDLLSFAQSTYNFALMLALVFLIMVVVLTIFAIPGSSKNIYCGGTDDCTMPGAVLQQRNAAPGRQLLFAFGLAIGLIDGIVEPRQRRQRLILDRGLVDRRLLALRLAARLIALEVDPKPIGIAALPRDDEASACQAHGCGIPPRARGRWPSLAPTQRATSVS